jgi:hypothetical protein
MAWRRAVHPKQKSDIQVVMLLGTAKLIRRSCRRANIHTLLDILLFYYRHSPLLLSTFSSSTFDIRHCPLQPKDSRGSNRKAQHKSSGLRVDCHLLIPALLLYIGARLHIHSSTAGRSVPSCIITTVITVSFSFGRAWKG